MGCLLAVPFRFNMSPLKIFNKVWCVNVPGGASGAVVRRPDLQGPPSFLQHGADEFVVEAAPAIIGGMVVGGRGDGGASTSVVRGRVVTAPRLTQRFPAAAAGNCDWAAPNAPRIRDSAGGPVHGGQPHAPARGPAAPDVRVSGHLMSHATCTALGGAIKINFTSL